MSFRGLSGFGGFDLDFKIALRLGRLLLKIIAFNRARRRRRGSNSGYRRARADETLIQLRRGKGRFNRVETFRRLHFRISAGRDITVSQLRLVRRRFQDETRRALHSQTNEYLLKNTPVRTGQLKGSLRDTVETNFKGFNRFDGFLEVRYNAPKGACYYARWVPRVRELLSSDSLLRRMRKAFNEGKRFALPDRRSM